MRDRIEPRSRVTIAHNDVAFGWVDVGRPGGKLMRVHKSFDELKQLIFCFVSVVDLPYIPVACRSEYLHAAVRVDR